MTETITATDANRRFAEMLRLVDEGKSFIVTSHGRPVARLEPIGKSPAERAAAYEALLEHWAQVKPIEGGRWTREELYER